MEFTVRSWATSQVQLSTMKQNSCRVMGEVTKSTGIGLDELVDAVEVFCTGVADSVLAEALLDAPDLACLQGELVQGPGRYRFSAAAIGTLLQRYPLAA